MHTLNFKPIFECSFLKIVGGLLGIPSTVGCALASLGHSLARVKFDAAAPPRGRNMVFRKS